jgi:mono/diheme cytochrome c family protein
MKAVVATVLLTLLACGAAAAASPRREAQAGSRGEYIARAADCISCHSRPGSPAFSGGDALKTPFGNIFAPNITPDATTGIGNWSEADFDRALRRGVRKDGAFLYPAMPYGSYTQMNDGDLHALWIYIRGIPAVNHTTPDNTLPFPFNIRRGIAVWQSLYFKPRRFAPAPDKDQTWNRGAYLVDALGHCGACHTPRNAAQALEPQFRLTGAQIEGWYAPNISSDALAKKATLSVDGLALFLKTGNRADNTTAIGPMQEVIHDSLRYLTDADLRAMAIYLKDQPGAPRSQQPIKPRLPVERLAAGKLVYEDNCSSCHGSGGKGRPKTVPALDGNSAVTARAPYNVIMAVLEGFPARGLWGPMGSFAATLNDDQITDVTNYIRTAWSNRGEPNATPWSVSAWRNNADAPAVSEAHALLCPTLASNVIAPALQLSAASMREAFDEPEKITSLVRRYVAARPQTTVAQAIEALSAAYCRAIATDDLSAGQMSGRIADFSQQVAVVMTRERASE